MTQYAVAEIETPEPVAANEVLLIASGDLRQSANEICWDAQSNLEEMLRQAFLAEGMQLRRAHPYDPERHHGFISGQRMGMDVFAHIHPEAPLVVAEAVWQYSNHVLAGPAQPSRPHSHRGQLVGRVAGPGRHAEPERLPAQGRRALQHPLEQGLRRSATSGRGCASGCATTASPMTTTTCVALR